VLSFGRKPKKAVADSHATPDAGSQVVRRHSLGGWAEQRQQKQPERLSGATIGPERLSGGDDRDFTQLNSLSHGSAKSASSANRGRAVDPTKKCFALALSLRPSLSGVTA
jgi:hypothetical protein